MLLHMYIVRHGQTYFNRYNRLQGWSNSPLTEAGVEDALKAGDRLKNIGFSAAFCSDTTRAQQTAQAILDANTCWASSTGPRPFISDAAFREQFYGYFEGHDMGEAWWAAGAPHGAPGYASIVEKYGLAATRDFLKEADPFHDAESDAEYWARIDSGFALIARTAEEWGLPDGSPVLQISHGNTLLSMMSRFAPEGYDLTRRPANGSITRFDFDTGKTLDSAISVAGYNE
ncbi:histidine phosphatase family protein [Scardovia wiggsiae]|nr:histidine phosphatase family protein [Scardovia wiggsiae]